MNALGLKIYLLFNNAFCSLTTSKTNGVEPRQNRGLFFLNTLKIILGARTPKNLIALETDVSARNIAQPFVRGESLAFFISKTNGVVMKNFSEEERKYFRLLAIQLGGEFNTLRNLLDKPYDVKRTSFKRHSQCLSNIIRLHQQAQTLLAEGGAL